ncbi:unnamed protein product [Rotaria socialis]|uniref:Uncharacterized protein n=1 Tax=Rotaria socialis TaxID=392032 RepID=A0A820PCS9_9BILA|nr:unnamed protein product [Rotaria socialis]CAF4402610.1 unnamed protein product [Rotaria socialis]
MIQNSRLNELYSTDSNDQLFRLILLLVEPNIDEVRNIKSKSDQIIYQQIQHKISLIDQSAKMIEHLTCRTKSDIDYVQFRLRLLQYSPNQRLTALNTLKYQYYDEIREKISLL